MGFFGLFSTHVKSIRMSVSLHQYSQYPFNKPNDGSGGVMRNVCVCICRGREGDSSDIGANNPSRATEAGKGVLVGDIDVRVPATTATTSTTVSAVAAPSPEAFSTAAPSAATSEIAPFATSSSSTTTTASFASITVPTSSGAGLHVSEIDIYLLLLLPLSFALGLLILALEVVRFVILRHLLGILPFLIGLGALVWLPSFQGPATELQLLLSLFGDIVGVGAGVVFGLGLANVFFGCVGWGSAVGRGGAIGAFGGFVRKGAVARIPAACCAFVFLFGFGNLLAGLLVFQLCITGRGTPGLVGLFDMFTRETISIAALETGSATEEERPY